MSIKEKIKRKLGIIPRNEKLLSFIDQQGLGLEIGPSFNPVTPKAKGFNVEIIDHLNADELRKKYQKKGFDLLQIEEVDFIWRGESLSDLIGKQERYDWIIASHVIEHTPDLISFLNDCTEILKPNGILVLAVPDARYCFDYFRPITGHARIIDAHFAQNSVHSIGTTIETLMLNAKNDGRNNWSRKTLVKKFDFGKVFRAKPELDKYKKSGYGDYIDYHSWCFTPSSFRLLINDLFELGLVSLSESGFIDTERHEFFITLKKNNETKQNQFNRLEMIKKMKSEIKKETSTTYKVLSYLYNLKGNI